MQIKHFFDTNTCSLSYVVFDEKSKDALIIDPVLNFDYASGQISKPSLNEMFAFIESKKLQIHYSFETHVHADHVSGLREVKKQFPKAKSAIGHRVTEVQATFKTVFNFADSFVANGKQFDALVQDNDVVRAGSLEIKALATGGHTPSCMCFLINKEAVFTGDVLFMPDYGTGRCDFPGASAQELYHSITKQLYTLPDHIKVFTGHDYMPGKRNLKFESTIAEQKANNIHLSKKTSLEEFVSFRNERDKTLNNPKLLYPSLQINIRAGKLPELENNGTSYLKIPLNILP